MLHAHGELEPVHWDFEDEYANGRDGGEDDYGVSVEPVMRKGRARRATGTSVAGGSWEVD